MKNLKTYFISKTVKILIFALWLSASSHMVLADEPEIFPLIKKARDHINLFQFPQAINLLKEAIKLDPNNWEAWHTVGLTYLRMQKDGDAEKAFIKALEISPREQDTQKALGSIYVLRAKTAQSKGKTNEMLDLMLKACRAYPGGTKIWASLFQSWWERGEYAKIKEQGDFIVTKNRNLFDNQYDEALQEAIVIVAKTYYRENDLVNTDNYLKLANSIRVHNEGMYIMRREIRQKNEAEVKKQVDVAEKHYANKEYDKAIEVYEQIAKMPGERIIDTQERIEGIKRDIKYNATLTEIQSVIKAKNYEKALDLLTAATEEYFEEQELLDLYESTKALYDAELAKQNMKMHEEALRKRREHESAQRYKRYLADADNFEKNLLFDQAIGSIERAMKENSKEAAALKVRITSIEAKKAEYAKRANDFRDKFSEVERANDQEEYVKAYELCRFLEKNYPEKRKDILHMLAELALLNDEVQESKRIAEEFKDSNEILYNYISAFAALETNDYDSALKFFEKVRLKQYDFRGNITKTVYLIYLKKYFNLLMVVLVGTLLLLSKKLISFLKTYRMTLLIRKVERIREKGDYEKHLDFLEEHYMKEDLPDMRTVTLLLAGALYKTESYQRAYDLATTLLKRESKNPLARKIAGEASMQLNDTSTLALEHIQNLYKLDESRKDIVTYLANAFMKNGADHKVAQDFILQGVNLSPDETDLVGYLANIYIARQVYNTQTVKIFDRAIKFYPEEIEYYRAIIANYKKIGDAENEEKWIVYTQEKFPDQSLEPNSNTGSYIDPQSYYNQTPAQGGSTSAYPDYDNIGGAAPSDGFGIPKIEGFSSQEQTTTEFPSYETPAEQPQDPAAFYQQPQLPQEPQMPGLPPQQPIQPEQPMPAMPSMPSVPAEPSEAMEFKLPSVSDFSEPTPTAAPNTPPLAIPSVDDFMDDTPLPPLKPDLPPPAAPAAPTAPAAPIPPVAPVAPAAPRLQSGQIACPHCNAPNPTTEYYCGSCGRPLG